MNLRKILRFGIPAAVLTIIALLALAPFLFKDRLIAKTKDAINAHLNAKVDFSGVSLSLFRDFPNVSLCLRDLSINGVGTFEGVTLLKAPAITVAVDLKSALRPKMPLIIHGIRIQAPELRVLTTRDGMANYLILKPGAEVGEAPADPLISDSARVVATIEEFIVTDGNIWYEDASMGLKIHLQGVSHNSSGDVTASVYDLKTITEVERLTVEYGGVTFLNAARADLDAGFRVNQRTETYTFLENKLHINALSLKFEGALRFLERGYAMDFKLRASENDFKDFFSIIPGAYLQGYEAVRASGKFDLKASMTGVYDDSLGLFPAYDIGMEIGNGKVRYPELPLGISGINGKLRLYNPVSDPDSLQVEVPALALTVGSNPIQAAFHPGNTRSWGAFPRFSHAQPERPARKGRSGYYCQGFNVAIGTQAIRIRGDARISESGRYRLSVQGYAPGSDKYPVYGLYAAFRTNRPVQNPSRKKRLRGKCRYRQHPRLFLP